MANLYPNLRFSRRRDHEYKPTLTKFCWNKPWHKKHTWSFLSLIGNMAAEKPKNPVFVYRVKTYPHLVIRKNEWARAATSSWSPLAPGAGKNRVPSICSGTWLPLWHHDALPRRNNSTVRLSRGASGPARSTSLHCDVHTAWSSRSRDDPLSATARFQQL